jgi:hypothetical protein
MERNFKVLQGDDMVKGVELDNGMTFVYATTNRGEDLILAFEEKTTIISTEITTGTTPTSKRDQILESFMKGDILEVDFAILLIPNSNNSYQMAPYEGPLNSGKKYMNTKNFVTMSFDIESGIKSKIREMIDEIIRPSRSGLYIGKPGLNM